MNKDMAAADGNPLPMHISRRRFLRGASAAAGAGWLAPHLLSDRALARALAGVVDPRGTTLEATLVPVGTGPYRRLAEGPGLPTVVRTLGVEARSGRESRRVAVASIVHLTDVHVIDAQSPARVEFLDRYSDPPSSSIPFSSAQRPQETLTAQVAESMVRRINALKRGPVTGRKFDCAVSTGDNIDNQQLNELEWFVALLDGGPLTPNSGDPSRYEGVQDLEPTTYDQHYWHPDDENPNSDFYKRYWGFPAYPGLLAAAVRPFAASGLDVPWYTVNGNHDGLAQGNAPGDPAFGGIATGPVKVVNLPAGMSPGDFQRGLTQQDPAVLAALATAPARVVTPDPRRRFVNPTEYAQAHFGVGPSSPGPDGHGLTEDNLDRGTLYYAFEPAPGVTGIVLDSVNRAGYAEGSLDPAQFAWLRTQLDRAKAAERLVAVFSHHSLRSMTNQFPDPSTGGARITGTQVEALLHEYPNVVVLVNGHSHENRVIPHPRPGGGGGFWEILTAAHVDYPQQARLVELVDNRDGSLSIFGTIVEHAAPASAAAGATDVLSLAAISRELSLNDFQVDGVAALGAPTDRNVELLLPHPFPSSGTGGSGNGNRRETGADVARSGAETLPATGAALDGRLAVGAAALGAALALRRRRDGEAGRVS